MKIYNDELCHFGIMGMRWGKRKVHYLYTTTGAKEDAKRAKKESKRAEREAYLDAKDSARRSKESREMYRDAVADTKKWEATVAARGAKREADQARKAAINKEIEDKIDEHNDGFENIVAKAKDQFKKDKADTESVRKRAHIDEIIARGEAEDQAKKDKINNDYEAFKITRDKEHAKVEEQRVKTKDSMAKYMAKYKAEQEAEAQAKKDKINKEIADKIDEHNKGFEDIVAKAKARKEADYQTKQNVQDSIKKLDEGSYKYNNERSGPILSSDEVNKYKHERDNNGGNNNRGNNNNTALIVRNNNGGNNNGGNNNGGNNNGGNNNGGNNRKDRQDNGGNDRKDNGGNKEKADYEEMASKKKAEQSVDRLKLVGASGKVGQSAVSLGQTVVKNHFEAINKEKSSKMTDEELQRITTRMELENRYMNAKGIQDGRSKATRVLSTIGSAFGVVTSGAVMYEALKKVKG